MRELRTTVYTMESMMKPHALSTRLAGRIRSLGWTVRVSEKTLGPLLDLLIRVSIAQAFFVSGVLKAANWDNALLLAASEYPVSWLDPVAAAWLGAGIELIGSVLLAAGLATRAAALSMLVLALVIQFNYLALDTHLLWTALLGWYVVMGSGALSLDALLARGLGGSAIPYAAAALRLGRLRHRTAGPGVCVGAASVAWRRHGGSGGRRARCGHDAGAGDVAAADSHGRRSAVLASRDPVRCCC